MKNLSYSTVKHHRAQISGIFTYFISCKKLSNNICLNTTIYKNEDEKMLDTVITDIENFEDDIDDFVNEDFITPEQAVQVLNLFMNTPMMLPVALAMFCGLRRSETCGILKTKLNKENKSIIIDSSRVTCGSKTIFKKRNKNKTSSRILYIPQLLMDIIELDEKRQQKNKAILRENYIDSKFLCVMDTGEAIKVNYISQNFKRTFDNFINIEKQKAEENGTDFNFPKITYHKLRHFNISALLANGAILSDVKDNSGHSDINTTLGYTHQYTTNKKEVANKIDDMFTPYLKLK